MTRTIRIGILGLAALLACAGAARAQGAADEDWGMGRPASFGVGGGVSMPVSDAADAYGTGWVLHGFVRLNEAGLPFGVRMDLDYHSFDLDPDLGVSGSTGVFAALGEAEFDLSRSSALRSYGLAGLGAYFTTTNALGGSSTDVNLGLNLGGGAQFRIGSQLAFLEARIDYIFTDEGRVTPDSIQLIPVTFGLVF